MWRSFFEGINDLFVNVLFAPFDFFRFMDNWWAANTINWILAVVGMVAFVYWMLQLKEYAANDEEDKSISSHSYL
ncbi:uracil phosphoribosyltransferase [Aurantibacter sp.]|uniref:DUF6341 family protein n=1 Tax=Aurantibacter sp. TaxID=2807103 RepID=UPI0032668D90